MQNPIPQLTALHCHMQTWQHLDLAEGSNLLAGISGQTFDIVAEFELGSASEFGFRVHKNAVGTQFTSIRYNVTASKLNIDRTNSGDVGFHPSFPVADDVEMLPVSKRIKMRILLDWSSIEFFGNDGEIALSYQVFSDEDSDALELFVRSGEVHLISLTLNTMDSTWQWSLTV